MHVRRHGETRGQAHDPEHCVCGSTPFSPKRKMVHTVRVINPEVTVIISKQSNRQLLNKRTVMRRGSPCLPVLYARMLIQRTNARTNTHRVDPDPEAIEEKRRALYPLLSMLRKFARSRAARCSGVVRSGWPHLQLTFPC